MTDRIKLKTCDVCNRVLPVLAGHRCQVPASAQSMEDWLELNALDGIREAWDKLLNYYLFESEDGKKLTDIERAHLLESIRLKIVFQTVDPEEVKEWLNYDPFKETTNV